jgi:hypothetical protein
LLDPAGFVVGEDEGDVGEDVGDDVVVVEEEVEQGDGVVLAGGPPSPPLGPLPGCPRLGWGRAPSMQPSGLSSAEVAGAVASSRCCWRRGRRLSAFLPSSVNCAGGFDASNLFFLLCFSLDLWFGFL